MEEISLEDELSDRLRGAIASGGGELIHDPESRFPLVTRLQWFIDAALRLHPDWSPYWWVDDLTCSIQPQDAETVVLRGEVTWVAGRNWYIDPVRAKIRLARTLPQIESFAVDFGDATIGIGCIPFDAKPPASWSAIAEWQLTVSGDGYPEAA